MSESNDSEDAWVGDITATLEAGEASVGIAALLAEAKGVPITEIDPLSEFINTDGLDNVLADGKSGHSGYVAGVMFEHGNFRVRAKSDGMVYIERGINTDEVHGLPMPTKEAAMEKVGENLRARYTETELAESIAAIEAVGTEAGDTSAALLREITGIEKRT